MAFERIAVVGAGAWGIALANVIARAGRTVLLAAREGADVLAKTRESPRLPGVQLDARIAVAPVGTELSGYDAILLAVPSQNTRAAARALAPRSGERAQDSTNNLVRVRGATNCPSPQPSPRSAGRGSAPRLPRVHAAHVTQ